MNVEKIACEHKVVEQKVENHWTSIESKSSKRAIGRIHAFFYKHCNFLAEAYLLLRYHAWRNNKINTGILDREDGMYDVSESSWFYRDMANI